MVSEKDWPATVALPGSVSTGTLRPEDLIAAFHPVLMQLNPRRASQLLLAQGDDLQEYVVELMDALDEEAPAGYHFGTIEGDGADFGFWEDDEDGD